MAQLKDQFQNFVSDPKRRRLYEREALALEASELISDLMQQEKVNKTELAERIGTSKSHITNLLSGSRNMTMHTLADLTFVLGCKVEIKASPLCDVMDWLDMDELHNEAYSDDLKRRVVAYKPARERVKPFPIGCGLTLDGELAYAV